jgi:chromosome segregation ATPase
MAERGKGLLEEITQHGLVGSSAHTTANTLYTDAEERRVSAEKNRLEKQAELMNVVTEMMSIFAGVLPPPAPGTTSIFLPPLDPPKLEVSVPDHSAEIWALREELNELKGVLHSHLGLVKEQTEDIKKLEAKLDEARQSAELQVAEARDAFQKQLEEAKAEVTAEFEKVGSRISFGWDVHDKRFLETCQKALVRDTRIAELESQWSKALGMKSELDELQQKVPVLSEHVGTALKHSQMVDKKVKENVDAVNTTIEEIKMDIQREQSEGAGRGFRLNAITADIQRLQDDIKPISQAQTASESRMKTLEERYDAHLVIVSGLQDQFNQLIAESKKRKRDEDDEGEDESVEGPGGPTPISRKARFKVRA